MLTKKQSQLLLYIHQKIQENGISPSFDEMKDALGLKSKSGIHRLVGALEERGFLKRLANRARALEVVKLPHAMDGTASPTSNSSGIDNSTQENSAPQEAKVIPADFSKNKPASGIHSSNSLDVADIPLHGKIAAGTPIEALENPDSHIPIPMDMMGRQSTYALTVDGDSMEEMGIMDGDTVLIESTTQAREGDVVVALIDNEEATLKTFRRQNNFIALVPANRHYETQIYEPGRVKIQGKLIGLMRRYH